MKVRKRRPPPADQRAAASVSPRRKPFRTSAKEYAERFEKELKSMTAGNFRKMVRQAFETDENEGGRPWKAVLTEVALKQAKRGDFYFWSKLIDLHESKAVTEDDVNELVEKVYLIVRRHIEKLDGGLEALANIARDLKGKT